MKEITKKTLSLVLCLALGSASFSLCGCDIRDRGDEDDSSETSASQRTTEATESDGDDPDDADDSALPDSLQSDDPSVSSEEAALEIAERVGLTEEDLRGEYDLFLEYAGNIESNPDLLGFKGYIYHLFPMVADHLESEDEVYFMEKVSTLRISYDIIEAGTGAFFSPADNSITISENIGDEGGDGIYALTIYHELVHFIDYAIDGEVTYMCYMQDGSIIDSSQVVDDNEVAMKLELSGFVEGGSEYYLTRYFDAAPTAMYYLDAANFMSGIEYIFGSDTVDEIFFHHDTGYRFAQLLLDNGFTEDEVIRTFNSLTYWVYGNSYPADRMIRPQEVLIRLYINNIGDDYQDDLVFLEILAGIADGGTFDSLSSPYALVPGSDSSLDSIRDDLEVQVADEYYNGSTEVNFRTPLCPVQIDGETRFVVLFFLFGGGSDINERTLILNYDFDTDTVIDYEIVEHDWIPPEPSEQFDDPAEADQYITEHTVDNSGAHGQSVTGTVTELSAQYERACDIGNEHGVYIWFADLVPEGVLGEDQYASDPTQIDETLDDIEAVLSLYPEVYFDQLLFEYYSGFVICLYDGPYDPSLGYTIYSEGRYYMTIFLSISETSVHGYLGAEEVRTESFSGISVNEAQLIVGIWDCTEKFFGAYCSHLSDPPVSEQTWKDTNHSYFYYADSTDEFWVENCLEYDDEAYLLRRESVMSAKTDRVLLYEYMMLAALSEATSGTMPAALTPECLNKVNELRRAIRAVFDTSFWDAQESWESVDL